MDSSRLLIGDSVRSFEEQRDYTVTCWICDYSKAPILYMSVVPGTDEKDLVN